MKLMNGSDTDTPPFAPPFIKDGDKVIGQTAVILDYLAPRIGLAPKVEGGRGRGGGGKRVRRGEGRSLPSPLLSSKMAIRLLAKQRLF